MFRRIMTNAAALLMVAGPARATAEPACLPRAVISEDATMWADLGLVGGAPTICVERGGDHPGVVGCWGVDAKTGKLSETTAARLPGHAAHATVDDKGCTGGFCIGKRADDDPMTAMIATSTDGAHVVVRSTKFLYVFDAATRKLTRTIDTFDPAAPEPTNVSNEITDVLYVGNTIYCEGHDAGPFAAVWAYRDDGTRLGSVDAKDQVMVFGGGSSVLDDSHVGLSTSGLETLAVVSVKDGTRKDLDRHFKRGPCKAEEVGEPGVEVSKACQRHLAKKYAPYAGAKLVLAGAGFLGLVRQNDRPELAVFDGKLAEKKRLKLKICAK